MTPNTLETLAAASIWSVITCLGIWRLRDGIWPMSAWRNIGRRLDWDDQPVNVNKPTAG